MLLSDDLEIEAVACNAISSTVHDVVGKKCLGSEALGVDGYKLSVAWLGRIQLDDLEHIDIGV